jgi:cystathionine gamma-synthase
MTKPASNDVHGGDESSGASPPEQTTALVHTTLPGGAKVSEASCPDRRTRAVRAGIGSDATQGAVVPPIHLSSTFTFAGYCQKRTYDYTRSGNPTRDELAKALATLEGGAGGVVTASGMAAVLLLLNLLKPGELLLAPHDCYGGSYRQFSALAERGHFEVLFVDQTDPWELDRAFARHPRMVWVETPSNPLLRITDLAAVSRRARSSGALMVVDNTFLSPVWQRPLGFGADIVLHSTTKYLNGHSDVVGGAVVAATASLVEELSGWANCLGLTGAPFDSYLTLRGLRTLYARMACHQANAKAVVECLRRHPAVLRVYHPSLPDHAGHAIARTQQTGYGAMVSFELRGDTRNVQAFVEALECFSLAESLGGVESLVAHPATMTHASMDPDARRRAGITDRLLRLSVGIESAEDLVRDLERALTSAEGVAAPAHGISMAAGTSVSEVAC